jgi:hypothetical protein
MSQFAEGTAPSPQSFAPKLSILHLMMFTLATGLSLTLLGSDQRDGAHPLEVVDLGMEAMLLGAALAGTVILVWRLVQQKCEPEIAPGHWLLASFALYQFVAAFLNRFAPFEIDFGEGINARSVVRFFGMFLGSSACLTLWTAAAYCQRSQRRWQVYSICQVAFCLIVAAWAACNSLGHFVPESELVPLILGALSILPALAGAVAFVVAVILDLVRRVPRDWLHYVGITIAFLNVFLAIARNVFFAVL